MSHLEEVSARVDAATLNYVVKIVMCSSSVCARLSRITADNIKKIGTRAASSSPKAARSCNPLKLALRNQPCANDQQQRAKRRPDHCA